MIHLLYMLTVLCFVGCMALENGLARTPPMGWMSWQRFQCIIDCQQFPDECISENLFSTAADLLVSEGYADVGYEYVIVDDCWLSKERDNIGRLQADPERFPCGIKALSNYIHSKNLKFGMYETYGKVTCTGYPGSFDDLQLDANTFADWDVDYLKVDGCFTDPSSLDDGYSMFGYYLNKTGRPIVYSCSWPYYQLINKMTPNFRYVSKYCNLWRSYHDIRDSWHSVLDIMNWYATHQDDFSQHIGPGHWNDPDMLVIGNYGLSIDQSMTQMAIWAIIAAPLIMSNDLNAVRPEFKEILQNRDVIAINQDKLGIPGRRIRKAKFISLWMRQVTPIGNTTSFAIAFVCTKDYGEPYSYQVNLRSLGLVNPSGYSFKDLYMGDEFVLEADGFIRVRVNPSGVVFYKATILP